MNTGDSQGTLDLAESIKSKKIKQIDTIKVDYLIEKAPDGTNSHHELSDDDELHVEKAWNMKEHKPFFERSGSVLTQRIDKEYNSETLALINKAHEAVENKEYEKAILHLKEARKIDPDNELVHIAYAKLFKLLGDFNEMLIASERAFELQPSMFDAMVLLGEALVENGKHEPLSNSMISRGVSLLGNAY